MSNHLSGSIKASIASQERTGVKVLLNQSAVINNRSAVGSYSNF
jgi:hypothetical protein